jgi:hypothetical protein
MKNLVNASETIFESIAIKLGQDACQGNCSDEFEHWSFQMEK